MEGLSQIFGGWTMTSPAALVMLLAFLTLFFLFAARARSGFVYSLRRIGGYEAIKKAVGEAAEMGKPLHMALGTEGIGSVKTLETLAGIKILEYLAEQSALCDTPLIANVAEPTALPVAQETMFRSYAKAGYPDEYDSSQVRYLAPDPVAYAAGVMSTLGQENLAANVMVGSFGDEFLLMSEAGSRRNIPQVSGMTEPNSLAFGYASVDHLLIGEEIFAGGAYLGQDPNHIGGLVAQDVMRTAIVLTAVIGVVLRTLGVF